MIYLVQALLLLNLQVATVDFVQVAGPDLQSRFESAIERGGNASGETFWVAYQFPLEDGVRIGGRDGSFDIDRGSQTIYRSQDGIVWIPEEGEPTQRAGLFLLARKSDGAIRRVRVLDLEENYEIRDREVYWLGLAGADESVDLLARVAAGGQNRNVSGLMMVMGLHDTERATERLIEIARGSAPRDVRKDAVFWLGQEVSQRAGDALRDMVMEEGPDTEIQKQAVFAISRRDDEESIPLLIDVAADHPNVSVRKQAIFWLGRKEDPRVVDFFERMLQN